MFLKNIIAKLYRSHGFSPLPMIALGFAGAILLGSLMLTLPVASATGIRISWFDALFTATSAVCVTGLVVLDTGTAFSGFGQAVLLVLIQIGGLGLMTFLTLVLSVTGRNVSLRERIVMRDSMNEDAIGGAVRLVRWVVLSAFSVEAVGAVLFSVRLVPVLGPGKGLFYSAFHAVSAFCNAGFDLFGNYGSLTGFRDDVYINITAIMLVVIGGLGFGVLADIRKTRRFSRLRLHTKLVLASYFALMFSGAILVLVLEWSNPGTLGGLKVREKMLAALFQSVTWRTAGFNTIDQQALRDCTKLIGSGLMIVGAAPASTGGGIKVTTFAIALLTVRMVSRGENDITLFRRRVGRDLIHRTFAVLLITASVVFADVCALSLMHPEAEFLDLLYECASAMGTVGISAIGSQALRPFPRILIMSTMFIGRVGPLTMALLFADCREKERELIHYPEERIMIG